MSFADFSDLRQPVQLLQRSLQRGRLSHAYLFGGNALDRLEAIAKTLAKTVNCVEAIRAPTSAATIDSCDRCLACRKIEHGNHPDIHWVRPESKSRVITIDQMRDLIHSIYLKPTEAAVKVAVIVAADRLNVQAANAFLKTLEEPPPKSLIILVTTESDRVLETLVSRCLRLNLGGEAVRPVDPDQADWLERFATAVAGPDHEILDRYHLLGELLDQLSQMKVRIEERLSAASPIHRHEEVDPKLKAKWEVQLDAAVEAEYRRQRAGLLAVLQYWFRDIWLRTLSVGLELLHYPNLDPATKTVAERISTQQAGANIETFEEAQSLLSTNVQETLTLEVSLLRLSL